MTRVAEETFLSWAAGLRILPDERYAPPRCLIYRDGRGDSRFWNLPRQRDELRTLLSHVLCGLEAWDSCYVWPRGGCWHSSRPPRSRIEEERALALYGGHIPDGLWGAVRYSTQEAEYVLNMIHARSRAAFCVTDDLFVVPDHATAFLHMDHHHVVHVRCSDAMRMERFIHHMTSGDSRSPMNCPTQHSSGPSGCNWSISNAYRATRSSVIPDQETPCSAGCSRSRPCYRTPQSSPIAPHFPHACGSSPSIPAIPNVGALSSVRLRAEGRNMRWASYGVQILLVCFGLPTITRGGVTITLIPNVPGAVYSSDPFGVSDDGNVVAGTTSFATNNSQQAWVWTRTGGTVVLSQSPYASGALGVSGDGSTIVGSEGDSPITARAVQWDRSGVVTPLSESAIYTSTTASAASHNGSVVVGEVVEGDSSVAMRWANGSSVVLADNAQAMAISADGSVVVGRFVPDVIQAFRWTAATGAVGLGFLPGGSSSTPFGISTDGSVVVGGANTAASGPFYEAFRWTAAGGMQSLGHIGGGTTFATACTADGSIVVGEANAQETAFIWDATHGMRTLADALEQDYGFDSSQFELQGALGISADGRYIVGYGSGDNFTGAWIISLPEPGSSAVLCAALGCLILRRGRMSRCGTTSNLGKAAE